MKEISKLSFRNPGSESKEAFKGEWNQDRKRQSATCGGAPSGRIRENLRKKQQEEAYWTETLQIYKTQRST